VIVYTADPQVRDPKAVLGAMVRGMFGSTYIAWRLFLKDVKSEYAKARLGILWDFLDPLVFASLYYVLVNLGILSRGDMSMPYPVFIVFGFLLFQTFRESIKMPTQVIKRSRNMLTQLKLPPECLILSLFYRILFNGAIRIVIMLVFAIVMGHFSIVGTLKFLALFPLLIFSGMAVGLLLAPFNTIYNDVGRVTDIVLTPLRFATPVMYSASIIPDVINRWNPITPFIENLRSLAVDDAFADAGLFWIKFAGFLVCFFIGWFFFHVSIPLLAERA
jgi:lipopolysaccharide transport system permease protein